MLSIGAWGREVYCTERKASRNKEVKSLNSKEIKNSNMTLPDSWV